MFQPRKVINLALGHFKKNIQIELTRNESHFLHNILTNLSSYWLVCLKFIFMWGFLCKNVMKMQMIPIVEWWKYQCLLMINTCYKYDNCYKAPKTL